MAASQYSIPTTPRVISPSPTPSESTKKDKDGYFTTVEPIPEDGENTSDPEFARARTRSRSPNVSRSTAKANAAEGRSVRRRVNTSDEKSSETNGFLSPKSAVTGMGASYWRSLSRSPSPLGLIPIHREWRTFIHKHEIPRKVLHVSIGFSVIYLYFQGTQQASIHPKLLTALIPIFLVDFARLHYEPLNSVYIRFLGAFMREAEAHDRYNGVISYLFGAWFVMYFCPKDVSGMSIILLSWCDTAASTFGRLYGKYTPRVRKGKSLAGSLAAFAVGVASAVLFWGVIAPMGEESWNQGVNRFAFDGHLTLPSQIRQQLNLSTKQATVDGPLALAIVSIWSGLVASVSEAIDIMGLDDNLTIPILCGIGLTGFLKMFE